MSVQIGNTAGGDVVGGDKVEHHHYAAAPTSLSRLYQILRDNDRAENYTSQIADQLRHYCALRSADVRGLDEKLKVSGRPDLIDEASELKERASKVIMRWQTSPVTQDIITHVLAKIHQGFISHIRPAIEAGRSREEVDSLIGEKVIDPTASMLGDNDLGLTPIDILGLLYYLGGNCHIRWDKC